jgi:uncharacterized protein YukE
VAFEGMDIDEVADLARQLDANARTLTGIAAVLGGLAEALSRQWYGPAAARFARDFETSHRPALVAAAQQLADMHARVIANLDQQQTASAATGFGGVSGPGALLGTGLRLADGGWHIWGDLDTAERAAEWPLDKIRQLAGAHEAPEPDGSGIWDKPERLTADHTFPLFEDTDVVRWLRDTPAIVDADKFLADSGVYQAIDRFGRVGIVMGLISVGTDVVNVGGNLAAGHYAAAGGDLVDAGSDALMSTKGWTWLAGLDLELAKKDYDEIAQGGLPPLTWSNLADEYLPAVTTDLPEEAWDAKGELFDLLMGDHG